MGQIEEPKSTDEIFYWLAAKRYLKGFVMWSYDGMMYAGVDLEPLEHSRSDIYYDHYPEHLASGNTVREALRNLMKRMQEVEKERRWKSNLD